MQKTRGHNRDERVVGAAEDAGVVGRGDVDGLGGVGAGTTGGIWYVPFGENGTMGAQLNASSVRSLGITGGQLYGTAEQDSGVAVLFSVGDRKLPFTAEGFLQTFSLPNFFFHATTAYDILRSKGVPLGKRDFLGKMKLKG